VRLRLCGSGKRLAPADKSYKDMGRKVTGSNKEVRRVLWSATAAGRLEWYMNNLRARHSLLAYMLPLLPVGSTSNESLHAEANSWFRTIRFLHQSTLELKLRILALRKQLPHFSAMCSPTTKQVSPGLLLANMLSQPLWGHTGEWESWCAELLTQSARVAKADLPLASQLRQRPAAAEPIRAPRKVTPFSRTRRDDLVRSGVRHTIYKKGAAPHVLKKPAKVIVLKRPSRAS